ncbi:MAG: ABC transporter permease [Actinomycetota bacterium]|nr:ABC transporter permease [Actinomycetota bacterium]
MGDASGPKDVAAVAEVRAELGDAPLRTAGLWSDAWRSLRRNPLFVVPAVIVAVFVVMAVVPRLFTSADPRACDLADSLRRPGGDHWFGFDIQGCDYYARVVYGARVSIAVGLLTVAGTMVVAVLLGSLAGYYGGLIDSLIARLTDVWFALPTVLGAIVILSVLGEKNVPQLVLVLIIFGWPTMTRLMRSAVLSVRDMEYVAAARALGAGDGRLVFRHILPNAIAPVVVYATIKVGIIIAAEATLSFLGLGVQLPAISWGLMIASGRTRLLDAPHLLLFPGLTLSLTVLSFVLMGDALRDAFDPRLR